MKRFAAMLGFLAIVGGMAVSAPAQLGAQTKTQSTSQTDRRAELERLRKELQKLQRELRELESELRSLRREGDRIAVARTTEAIRRLKTEIERLQRRIREFGKGR